MPAKSEFRVAGKSRRCYLKLETAFPLASIKSDDHFDAAQKVMDGLLAGGDLDDGEGEATYLDALSDLVAVYEDERRAVEPAWDGAVLRRLLEAPTLRRRV